MAEKQTMSGQYEAARQLVWALDPTLVEAADEIESELVEWVLSQSPSDRLEAHTRLLALYAELRGAAPARR